MQRLCERPGCGATSDASYGIDRMNLVVWVDRPEVAERETAGRLCRRHANALMVPRGWTLDDRRDPVPKLFKVPDVDTADAGRRATTSARRSASRRTPRQSDAPSLFESLRREIDGDGAAERDDGASVDTDGTSPVAEVDPDETQAMPWSPRLGRTTADDRGDRPRFGRLLGRAFGEPTPDDEE